MKKLLLSTLAIVAAVYLSTGIVVVQPNEEVIVRRFGRQLPSPLRSGLHFVLPYGLASIDRVRIDSTRQITIGTAQPGMDRGLEVDEPDATAEGRFLTGDQNLVQLSVTVQYSLSDGASYLFQSVDADRLIAAGTESLLTQLCATLPVDEILVDAQLVLGLPLQSRLQEIVDKQYGLGVHIRSLNVAAWPPAEVRDAFDDVAKARSDKQKKINDARSYEERLLQKAQAQAEQLVNEATVYSSRQLADAQGQAQRFEDMLTAYRTSVAPQSVAHRLLLEAMEELLPKVSKVLVGTNRDAEPIDLSVWRQMQ